MSSESSPPRLPFWPFLLADVIFVALGWFLFRSFPQPLAFGTASLLVVCVSAGAVTFLYPFLRRNATEQQLAQTQSLASTVAQIQKLESLATQISQATAQWQGVQEHATLTTDTARQIADSMAAEAKSFTDFLQKSNDTEKSHLRLELEKLRRNEGEWLQITTRILDHVFALAQAAVASGQPNVIQQVSHFQNACREVVRRMGLVPFIAKTGEPLDPNIHQLTDEESPRSANALVAETVATGYTYQGQLIRRALVIVHPELEPATKVPETTENTQPDAQPTLI